MSTSRDMGWAIPVMQAGYAGRGLVYLIVAGISLYSLWRGGQAMDTQSALGWLEDTLWGGVLLVLILLGMVSYALWRAVDSFYDLEAYGTDGKGLVARTGMLVTGLIHLGIGALAFSLLFSSSGGGGGSSIPKYVATVMEWPGGRWIIGIAALLILGAAVYYIDKGWKGKFRRNLRANEVTLRWNWVLEAGLIAQGVVVAIIGFLFLYAALQADPQEAGGVGAAFSWLSQQIYGQVLVAIICVGLLAFSLFCFVNARYRIVPRASGPDVETLASRLS